MDVFWSKSYIELATAGRRGFYSAVVRKHHWPDWYVFQATPNSGSHCVECKSQDSAALVEMAERWFAGDTPQEFYSSSY